VVSEYRDPPSENDVTTVTDRWQAPQPARALFETGGQSRNLRMVRASVRPATRLTAANASVSASPLSITSSTGHAPDDL